MRRCFIPASAVTSTAPVITGQDAAHISKVLRLKPGDNIELFDGAGQTYTARIQSMEPEGIKITILSQKPDNRESPARIILAVGMLKDRKMDDLIRPLTELGITCLSPFIAERSVSRPDIKRMENRMRRWQTIARESLKQCGRTCLPKIQQPASFEQILESADTWDIKLMFYENASNPFKQVVKGCSHPPEPRIFAMTGPEGGFTEQEVQQAVKAGFIITGLGARILKAETAALAVAALLQHTFGDLG